MNFNEIVGQEGIKAHLLSAIAENKISHAYIFSGEDGSGKMMLAERFAAALECDGEGTKPCGGCINCMQSESHNHPDIIYVTHEKKNILVDDIRRQLVNDIAIKPYSGKYKIYIIDEAEKMNEAAQNALLKTLEEPPAYAVLLLLATNTGAFLQTILSRCVTLELKPIETNLVKKYIMEKRQLPDYVAKLCASFSGGCIGNALRYADDQNFINTRDQVLTLLKNISKMRQSEIDNTLTSMGDKEKKESIDDYFNLMRIWFRDVLMYKSTHNSSRIIFSEELEDIKSQASNRSYENINNILLALDKAKEQINFNVSFEAAMQLLVQTMKSN